MQHFLRDGKAYWGGLHRELGLTRDERRTVAWRRAQAAR